MRVRFFDSETGLYHKSEVYAIVNTGIFERLLLLVPAKTGDYLKLFDSVKRSGEGSYEPMAERIFQFVPEDWAAYTSEKSHETLPEYRGLLGQDVLFYRYYGFPWLWKESSTLVRLLKGEKIPLPGSVFEGRLYSDVDQPGWNFIESQKDADSFLEKTCGLHDSTIHSILYESGNYVDEENVMHFPELRRVTMTIHSQWCPPVEMVFDGVTALNLRPPGENYLGDMFGCSLFVEDCTVFFSDCELEKPDNAYQGTWITAYSLRWRFL